MSKTMYKGTGELSEDDMLTLLDSDPELACNIAKDAAVYLVSALEEGLTDMSILDEYQKNLYVMAKIIVYLTKDLIDINKEIH